MESANRKYCDGERSLVATLNSEWGEGHGVSRKSCVESSGVHCRTADSEEQKNNFHSSFTLLEVIHISLTGYKVYKQTTEK
jgi:hypothetical protein